LPDKITLSKLGDARWVLPHVAGAFRRQVEALFVSTNTPLPANVIRCDSLLTTKAIVRQTDYVTILPRDVVAADLKSGTLREIPIRGSISRYVGVRMLADHEWSPLAEVFVETLRGIKSVSKVAAAN
jgi:DNA-binding transcriptional LysR family regulator